MCSLNPGQNLSQNLPAVHLEAGGGRRRPSSQTRRSRERWFVLGLQGQPRALQTPRMFGRTPGSEGFVCMGRVSHLVLAHNITLSAIQTSTTSCVSCHQCVRLPIHLLSPEPGDEQGPAFRCPPKAEGRGLSGNATPGMTVQLCPSCYQRLYP